MIEDDHTVRGEECSGTTGLTCVYIFSSSGHLYDLGCWGVYIRPAVQYTPTLLSSGLESSLVDAGDDVGAQFLVSERKCASYETRGG